MGSHDSEHGYNHKGKHRLKLNLTWANIAMNMLCLYGKFKSIIWSSNYNERGRTVTRIYVSWHYGRYWLVLQYAQARYYIAMDVENV